MSKRVKVVASITLATEFEADGLFEDDPIEFVDTSITFSQIEKMRDYLLNEGFRLHIEDVKVNTDLDNKLKPIIDEDIEASDIDFYCPKCGAYIFEEDYHEEGLSTCIECFQLLDWDK